MINQTYYHSKKCFKDDELLLNELTMTTFLENSALPRPILLPKEKEPFTSHNKLPSPNILYEEWLQNSQGKCLPCLSGKNLKVSPKAIMISSYPQIFRNLKSVSTSSVSETTDSLPHFVPDEHDTFPITSPISTSPPETPSEKPWLTKFYKLKLSMSKVINKRKLQVYEEHGYRPCLPHENVPLSEMHCGAPLEAFEKSVSACEVKEQTFRSSRKSKKRHTFGKIFVKKGRFVKWKKCIKSFTVPGKEPRYHKEHMCHMVRTEQINFLMAAQDYYYYNNERPPTFLPEILKEIMKEDEYKDEEVEEASKKGKKNWEFTGELEEEESIPTVSSISNLSRYKAVDVEKLFMPDAWLWDVIKALVEDIIERQIGVTECEYQNTTESENPEIEVENHLNKKQSTSSEIITKEEKLPTKSSGKSL